MDILIHAFRLLENKMACFVNFHYRWVGVFYSFKYLF